MSIQSEVSRLRTAKTDMKSVLEANGVAVLTTATLDAYPSLVNDALRNGSSYLYKALFSLDKWTSDGSNYVQTVTVTPIGGSPNIENGFTMASGFFVEDIYPDETQEIICQSASIVDKGRKAIGNGTLTCTTRDGEKPSSDVEVFFLVKNTYSSPVDESLRNGLTYLYKVLFLVDGWNGSDTYEQTAVVTPLAGAPAITSNFIMASGTFVEDIYSDETQEIISESGDIIDKGTKTIGNGTLTCTTRSGQKPTSDVEVFFLAKIES